MKRIALLAVCALSAFAAEKFGKGLTLAQPTPISTILASPDQYVGKVVQVRGKVTEVCQMMGCWLQIVDGDKGIRIKVTDGEIMFPKSSPGRIAIAEGTLKKMVLNREQAVARAKHEAEELGRKFDPASIQHGTTIYQIQGTGAVLVD